MGYVFVGFGSRVAICAVLPLNFEYSNTCRGSNRVCGVVVVKDSRDYDDICDGDGDADRGVDHDTTSELPICHTSCITLHLSPLAAHTLCVSPLQCCKVMCDV